MPEASCRLAIDFGTHNTVAVLHRPNAPDQILVFDGSEFLPSAVCRVPESNNLVVGRDALLYAQTAPDCFEPSPKSRIDDGKVLLGGKEFLVSDLVAAVLRRVLQEADRMVTGGGFELILSHPANWGALRRGVLIEAARKVGYPRPTLVSEPVAAAAYYLKGDSTEAARYTGDHLVVYDFGAGTLDVAVLTKESPDTIGVIASGGCDLGGRDLDFALIKYLQAQHPSELWGDLLEPKNPGARRQYAQLCVNARQTKEALSRASTAPIYIPLLDLSTHVTRDEFEAVIGDIIAKATNFVKSQIAQSCVQWQDLSGIYLVGGSSRIPLVATQLMRETKLPIITLERPEFIVALGCLLAARAQKALPALPLLPPAPQVGVVERPVVVRSAVVPPPRRPARGAVRPPVRIQAALPPPTVRPRARRRLGAALKPTLAPAIVLLLIAIGSVCYLKGWYPKFSHDAKFFTPNGETVVSLSYSQNGDTISALTDKGVIYDLNAKTAELRAEHQTQLLSALNRDVPQAAYSFSAMKLAVTPTGTRAVAAYSAASASGTLIYDWNGNTGKITVTKIDGYTSSLSLSADSTVIAVGGGGAVRAFGVDSPKQTWQQPAHDAYDFALCSPDALMWSSRTSGQNNVLYWDSRPASRDKQPNLIQVFKKHNQIPAPHVLNCTPDPDYPNFTIVTAIDNGGIQNPNASDVCITTWNFGSTWKERVLIDVVKGEAVTAAVVNNKASAVALGTIHGQVVIKQL